MMAILRNHEAGLCMHGSFETTSAMVSELRSTGARHWLTGQHRSNVAHGKSLRERCNMVSVWWS